MTIYSCEQLRVMYNTDSERLEEVYGLVSLFNEADPQKITILECKNPTLANWARTQADIWSEFIGTDEGFRFMVQRLKTVYDTHRTQQ
jgi:hypothetical protein